MPKTLKADGDVWRARLGGPAPREGYRNLMFFCDNNGQRPYRVVEVPDDGSESDAYLDRLSAAELEELFDRSGSLGAPTS